MQRLTDSQIAHGIVKYFWLSVGLGLLVLFGLGRGTLPGWVGPQEVHFLFHLKPLINNLSMCFSNIADMFSFMYFLISTRKLFTGWLQHIL